MIYRNRVNVGTTINTLPYTYPTDIPINSGDITVFAQTNAPTGYTKLTTHNDKALRVVSGTAGSGGTTAFSTVFTNTSPTVSSSTLSAAATTLTAAQIGAHTHFQSRGTVSALWPRYQALPTYGNAWITVNTWRGSLAGAQAGAIYVGGGGSHTHPVSAAVSVAQATLAVQYVDIIVAMKD